MAFASTFQYLLSLAAISYNLGLHFSEIPATIILSLSPNLTLSSNIKFTNENSRYVVAEEKAILKKISLDKERKGTGRQ